MHERIKKVRKEFDLTQQEFAKRIGVKRNTVATYEMGRSEPSDAAISLICREFDISEEWLRTGEGQMRIKRSKSEELFRFFARAIKDEPESFRVRLAVLMAKLDETDWKNIERYARMLGEAAKKEDQD